MIKPLGASMAGIVLVSFLSLAACSSAPKKMPPRPEPEAIANNQSVVVEFLADGRWWESGFLASPGDIISFEPVGAAAFLGPGAIKARFGEKGDYLLVAPGKPLRIDKQSHIFLSVEPRFAASLENKMARLKIVNAKTK